MTLFIIGNGFDLDLGLKTSYYSFIESEEFNRLLSNNSSNTLARHVKNTFNKDKNLWSDLEILIGEYANEFCKDELSVFKCQLEEVRRELKNYLNKQNSINSFAEQKNCRAFKFLNIVCNELENKIPTTFINFNYTDTVYSRLKYINKEILENSGNTFNYINPHGNLKTDIAFGVSDNFLKNGGLAYSFLKKGYSINYNLSNWANIYNKATNIYIFGHSLGITDSDIFKPMFSYYLSDKKAERNITLIDEKNSNDKIFNRIDTLTSGNIGAFRLNNRVIVNPF